MTRSSRVCLYHDYFKMAGRSCSAKFMVNNDERRPLHSCGTCGIRDPRLKYTSISLSDAHVSLFSYTAEQTEAFNGSNNNYKRLKSSSSPLLVKAAIFNKIPLVEALLKAGANPKVRVDYDCWSSSYDDDSIGPGQPLLKACIDGYGGEYDPLQYYFMDKKGKGYGDTCIPILIKYGAETSPSILTYALSENFNCEAVRETIESFIYSRDEQGLTDFHDMCDALSEYLVSHS